MGCECCKYGINGNETPNCTAPLKYREAVGCKQKRRSNYTPPRKKRKKNKHQS